ncbi:MAG TPA: DUF4167 domain-containing protein [Stellaceae bacterium]|nr:DUF4167 domain-containing protein [Stellaceae bacterium]
MRPGQNKRSRGRNGGGGPPHYNRGPRPPHRTQTFDSNGPNVKIRGNAYQVFERYIALAREAQIGGDRIAAESLYQHAEHYFRIMSAQGEGQGHGALRPTTPADLEMAGGDGDGEPDDGEEAQVHVQHGPPPMSQPPSDDQPPY